MIYIILAVVAVVLVLLIIAMMAKRKRKEKEDGKAGGISPDCTFLSRYSACVETSRVYPHSLHHHTHTVNLLLQFRKSSRSRWSHARRTIPSTPTENLPTTVMPLLETTTPGRIT
jgi:hypothetical protein